MTRNTEIITRSVMTTLMLLALARADAASQTKPIQIGMAKSYLEEKPKSYVDIATEEFKEVLKKTTGLDGELVSKFDAFEVAAKLDGKQLDFGVLHAHEFAWVQKKHPDLQPLLIAVNKQHAERVHLIVHKKNAAKTIADLRGLTPDKL